MEHLLIAFIGGYDMTKPISDKEKGLNIRKNIGKTDYRPIFMQRLRLLLISNRATPELHVLFKSLAVSLQNISNNIMVISG